MQTLSIPNNSEPMFVKRPWLIIVFAFLLLIAAWTALITIAVKHTPERIEVSAPAK
ncbi:hypothetical protein ACFQY0_18510 [Haloferula chungangensis]|uniref:Uncharacterized protein n=1 Tax=Haloferula chungangensis TaxID=1048331 RepID=A0ABW2LCX5_9BACT